MPEGYDVVRNMTEAGSPVRAAFDYLMAHARAAGFVLVPRYQGAVLSIELQWPDKRRNPFSAQTRPGHINFYLRGPILKAHEGLFEAAVARFGPVDDNRLDEYRTHLLTVADVDEMLGFLRKRSAWPSRRTDRRFVAATFEPVTALHIFRAAQRIAAGFSDHGFGPSTDYDLIFEDQRLPPKAVFGLAASAALGFPVRPENFSAGEGMICFRMLRSAGYDIIPKSEEGPRRTSFLNDDDRAWSEGRPRLVTHLRRERGTGLAAAKRAHFRMTHGRLFCERCDLDPIQHFGSDAGEACIEVHHNETHLAEMQEGHQTRLEDLQCLCANCHRVTHRELREAELTQ